MQTAEGLEKELETVSILGSGWLGLPLCEELVKLGHRINASTRSEDRFDDIAATGAQPFVVNIETLTDQVQHFLNADILIINITSKNLAAFARLITEIEGSPVSKVIFVSSTSVYRNTNDVVTEADGAEDPDSPLFRIENLFRSSTAFQTTVIRFAGLIGYSRHPGRFFQHRNIPGPDIPVNLIHRDDCVAIVIEVIRQQAWGEVFNACADTHPSKREFYSHASRLLGLPPPGMAEPGDNRFKIVSNDKLKQRFGYRFKHSDLLRSGL